MKKCLLPLVFLLLMLALGGCGNTQPKIPVLEQNGQIRDLSLYPQNLLAYANQASGLLLAPAQSNEQAERFIRIYFAPWRQSKVTKGDLNFFRAELNRNEAKRGYAENLLPWNPERWQAMVDNANLESYPSFMQPAITVRPASARTVPTMRPGFTHPTDPGQGFPFDNFQQTVLPVGLPLLLTHISSDGAWFLMESSVASGWVPAQDVAFADADFRRDWQNNKFAVVMRDELSLKGGSFFSHASLGTLLPFTSGVVLVPLRKLDGKASITWASVENGDVAAFPQPFAAKALAELGNKIMGQAYGWGGMFNDRDCSATMRDIFAPFGLWLPRNSASQAKSGDFISFENLNTAERKALIIRQGKPFITLLYMPGHIGLYIGQQNGEPLFFHNIWGVRLDQGKGNPSGRFIIGRAVVTSTEPGGEIPNATGLLINRMTGMTILGR